MLLYIYNTLISLGHTENVLLRVQISGVMGSTSLACWMVLLMPQLVEQWRLKSAEGIAIGFISIWFLGDVFNLIGAVWAGLLPEVIFLAIWFCFADFMMIFSYFYYTHLYKRHHHHHNPHAHPHRRDKRSRSAGSTGRRRSSGEELIGEERPLLRRRRSSTLTDIALEPQYHSVFVKYILPILFVVGAGVVGFFLGGANVDGDHNTPGDDLDGEIALGPQIMGYCSALLYLGARIPQIIQNYHRKSVHGLSLLFFLFSTLGNLTYAGQILFYRSDSQYILLNLSWLLGSLGTIFEDSIIFLQFYLYRENNQESIID